MKECRFPFCKKLKNLKGNRGGNQKKMPCFSSHYCHGPCVWNFLINVKVYNILLALACERIDRAPTHTHTQTANECVWGGVKRQVKEAAEDC